MRPHLRNEEGLLPTGHMFPAAGPGPADRQRLSCEVHGPGLRAPGSGLRVQGRERAEAPLNKGVALTRSQGGGRGAPAWAPAWAQDERPAVNSLITSKPQIKPLLRA